MTDDLIAAVQAGDASRVSVLVAGDPSLANARDAAGVSAILLSRYRSDRAVTDALLAADPDLDVFEAAALGYADRLTEHLDTDPAAARAWSRPTASRRSTWRRSSARPRRLVGSSMPGPMSNAVSQNAMRRRSRCTARPPGATTRSAACC